MAETEAPRAPAEAKLAEPGLVEVAEEVPQPEEDWLDTAPPTPTLSLGSSSDAGDHRLFIGGLSRGTTEQDLAGHFGQFGSVVNVNIALNKITGLPRGFGFVKFALADAVEKALGHESHVLDHREVDVKRAVTRAELEAQGLEKRGMAVQDAQKLFVGGLTDAIGEAELRMYMNIFGVVTGVQIVCDAASGRPRGFAFVTFASPEAVSNVLRHQVATPHIIKGNKVEVKPFVSGGLAGSTACSPQQKIFVGGLPREITEAAIYDYFGQFGQVVNVHNYKGYCFVTFQDTASVQQVLSTGAKSHFLLGKQVEVKPYTEQRLMNRSSSGSHGHAGSHGGASDFNAPDGTPDEQKVFIGGCSVETTEDHLSAYFSHYGSVLYGKVARDPVNGRSKGFAFVAFADPFAAQQAIAAQTTRKHEILGRPVDLRPYAKPKQGAGHLLGAYPPPQPLGQYPPGYGGAYPGHAGYAATMVPAVSMAGGMASSMAMGALSPGMGHMGAMGAAMPPQMAHLHSLGGGYSAMAAAPQAYGSYIAGPAGPYPAGYTHAHAMDAYGVGSHVLGVRQDRAYRHY